LVKLELLGEANNEAVGSCCRHPGAPSGRIASPGYDMAAIITYPMGDASCLVVALPKHVMPFTIAREKIG